MKYPNLKKIIQPSIPLIGVLIACFLGIWILNYFFSPAFQNSSVPNLGTFSVGPLWSLVSIFLITSFNILLITQLNSRYSIVRVKTFLLAFFYALFISVWKENHLLISSHLSLTAFLISLLLFLGMYRDRKAVEPAFLGSFLISLTGLFNPVYLFLIPVSWIGFMILKSQSIKVFLASLIGLVIPWIFYFSYHLWMGNEIHLFDNLLYDFQPYFLFTGKPIYELVYSGAIFILIVVSIFGIYTNLLNDTVQTRKIFI